MSDSVQPHRRQPTRLHCPWDSPGKNTGVSCHFLLQGMEVKSESEVSQSCPTLNDPMDCSLPGSSVHGIFQAKSTGVGCHCFLSYNQEFIAIIQTIQFQACSAADCVSLVFPVKTTLKTLAHVFLSFFFLSPDQSWCFSMWSYIGVM